MIFGLFLLAAIALIWFLLVEGWLYRIILGIGGWFGIYLFLNQSIVAAHSCPLTIFNYSISWAAIIPTIILILAMAHTKE